MENLSAEYLLLFNAVSETVNKLEEMKQALLNAQMYAEDLYISKDDQNAS